MTNDQNSDKRSAWAISRIRTIPDFPQSGIQFRDITTLLADPYGFRKAVDELVQLCTGYAIDRVVGIESRGFILGGAMAHQLGAGFVPVRKAGKLPAQTLNERYELEYGEDELQLHVDAIAKSDRVLLVDDLVATGGTACAAANLIERCGATIVAACFVIDLPDLGGSQKLRNRGLEVASLCCFEGD